MATKGGGEAGELGKLWSDSKKLPIEDEYVLEL